MPAPLMRMARHRRGGILRVWPAALCVCALLAIALLSNSASVSAEETNMRLRVAWGGGESRQWRGTISISEGTLSELVPLGLEADEPGSIYLEQGKVVVNERSPRNYDGVDLLVTAALDATLFVDLTPVDPLTPPAGRIQIPLTSLVTEFQNEALDKQGNRLLVRRSPGDRLRVKFNRDSLVFAPGDLFELEVVPHLTGITGESSMRCKVQLLNSGSETEVSSEEQDVRLAADGSLLPVGPYPIVMPAVEGVYDVRITLTPRRLTAPFVRAKPLLERAVQLVVIDKQPPPPSVANWRAELEIDPANPGWWDRLKRMSHWSVIPGLGQGPLGNGKSRSRELGGRSWIELDADGWQAYPLPVSRIGQPHILEVEYPGDLKQTLGISIIEPNAAGSVAPIGLDSGVDVPEPPAGSRPPMQQHRLLFWPKTKTPFVLLTNRREDSAAQFGRIRVLTGPATLPALPLDDNATGGRLLAAYFDKPLFPENFSAGETLDSWTGRTLDDWTTFYLGGRRLAEYLKYAGYNGAVVPVLCEGSALYPSKLLDPTPKYDTGTFFATGQDVVRKDVLRMMFRLFDREGLKLIPAVQFAAPLPELERMRRAGGTEADGLELIDADGKTWLARNGTRGGLAPYYNPLDPRVQTAMIGVARELAERYAEHSSFAGLALQLGPDTYSQLPSDEWGLDDRTIARFQKETTVAVPGQGAARYAQRADFLLRGGHKSWLSWRAAGMTAFYDKLQKEVATQRTGAKLYLATADVLTGQSMQSELRPTIPARANTAAAMLQIGIDAKLLEDRADIVLLRPRRLAPDTSLAAQAVNLEFGAATDADRFFSNGAARGGLSYHEPQTLRLPSFDAVSPFGKDKTFTWLVAQVSPADFYNRRRFVHHIATLDGGTILDGGWLLPLGQEESLRPFVEVYRRLPAERFETAAPKTDDALTQGVVVRTLTRGATTFVYLVNDAPWRTNVELELRAPADCRVDSLSSRSLSPLRRDGQRTLWTVQLEPYDLVGATMTAPRVTVENWQARLENADEVALDLRQKLQQVRARTAALRNPPPLEKLANPGFELPAAENSITGWVQARGSGITVGTDRAQHRNGTQSLRVASNGGVAWVRSEPFEPPKTGRLSVWVWLKVTDPERQPPLRLAIEGQWNGQTYYKWAWVGSGLGLNEKDLAKIPRLQANWAPYLFHVDDLPPQGLTELRVGFDLMAAGEVWIDDVQLFDLWFYDNERDELLKRIAVADFQLGQGKAVDCQRFLDSYWPRLLMRHVKYEPPRMAANPRPPMSPAPESLPPPEAPAKTPTWQRYIPKLPTFRLPFQSETAP
jgi:hypothetical protein